MKAYILLGSLPAKDEFTGAFIKQNNIPSYNISTFSEPVKIADARSIKKEVSISSSGRRLFVIKAKILPEAQNALLKTLEELPESTDFIFFEGRDLLPTVVSRCTVINLENRPSTTDAELYEKQLLKLTEENNLGAGEIILFADSVFSTEFNPEAFGFALRNVLRILVGEEKFGQADFIAGILNIYFKKYPLLVNNNLNSKLALESIILNILLQNEAKMPS
jgi:hypothetical protein